MCKLDLATKAYLKLLHAIKMLNFPINQKQILLQNATLAHMRHLKRKQFLCRLFSNFILFKIYFMLVF